MDELDGLKGIMDSYKNALKGLPKAMQICSAIPTEGIFESIIKLEAQTRQTYESVMPHMEQISKLCVTATQSIEQSMKSINTQALSSSIERLRDLVSVPAINVSKDFEQITKLLEAYSSPIISEQLKRTIDNFKAVNISAFSELPSFDFSKFKVISEEVISYDGIEYSGNELATELDDQIKAIKEIKPTLREKLQALKQRLWLLTLILNLILFLPEIPEKVEFYRNTVLQLEEVAEEKRSICFTIKEKSILREEPKSDSLCILSLPYDTALKIIETIPRWYKVEYVDGDGEQIIGWISKICVEID